MSDFKIDKRDLEFALFEHTGLEELTQFPRYQDFTRELFEMVLNEGIKFATEELAPSRAEADEEGCRIEDGQVMVPKAYEEVYDKFCQAGFFAPAHSPEYGGQGLPYALGIALTEAFIGAHPSFMFRPGLSTAAGHLIETFGTDAQKEMYLENLYTGNWTGTMCLTEPQAGSSVGDLKTTAEPVDGEDFFLMTGNKIFISEGDHQLVDNVVHLVLARIDGDPEGIKGVSLFVVPKNRVNEDGSPGDFNDVRVTGLEEKMGIHGSATCSMSFGDDGECQGWLVGERCKGIVYMFQMMNEARLITGLQGSALGNAAYQIALDYAKERKQGSKVTERNSDSVAIVEHPDVRRNLMLMKAYGEASRAIVLNAATFMDRAHYAEDEAERTKYQDMLDLLTPVCKAFCSDVGFRMTEIAMQVLGGYGYVKEYGVEQYMRDVKIASIYEGSNGIQALDLLGRKMRMKNGGLFLTWLQEINGLLEEAKADEAFEAVATQIEGAKNALAEASFGFSKMGKKDPEYPLLHATPFLRMFGLVESAKLLLEQAMCARERLTAIWADKDIGADDADARSRLAGQNEEVRYLENKIKTNEFFAYQILPEVKGRLESVQSGDRSALDIDF